MSDSKPGTSYVHSITAAQAEQLRAKLEAANWELDTIPYAIFRAKKDKTTCTAYTSGKLTVQGKGTAELVQFVIEPEIVGEARFGYEDVLAREENPEMYEPHAGIDESGKGDFFGPMVIACCYVDPYSADDLYKAGVQDSKAIKSDRKIAELAKVIRNRVQGDFSIVRVGPAAYNRMYAKFRNVNRMLAWGHATALEELLEKRPDCPRALSDQFGPKSHIQRALKEKGKKIIMEQRTKAESDIAVAAASILARQEFVQQMQVLGERAGMDRLPRGASAQVKQIAIDLAKRQGIEALADYCKLHFQTYQQVRAAIGLPPTIFDEQS